MKKNEELQMILRDVIFKFEKEEYERSMLDLRKAGKLIISRLNARNKRR